MVQLYLYFMELNLFNARLCSKGLLGSLLELRVA